MLVRDDVAFLIIRARLRHDFDADFRVTFRKIPDCGRENPSGEFGAGLNTQEADRPGERISRTDNVVIQTGKILQTVFK